MAEAESTEVKPEAAGGSKKKLILIGGLALVVLGAGGAGAYFFLGKKSAPAAETATKAEETKAADATATTPAKDAPKDAAKPTESNHAETKSTSTTANHVGIGETFTLKPFQLNLGNPLENHYARMEIALEYKGGETQKLELEKRLPQLRDAVVSVASRKSREFLLGPDGKDQLRKEILIRINRYMTQPIESVYITDILIE